MIATTQHQDSWTTRLMRWIIRLCMKELLTQQRDMQRRYGSTEVKETPGNIPGFDSFYETGSFVPTLVGGGTAGTFTYTANQCLVEWTRSGNRLLFNGRIVITAIGTPPTGNLSIAGFPFAGVSDATMAIAGGGTFIEWAINMAAGYTDAGLQAANGSTSMIITRSGDNLAPGAVQGGELIIGDFRFWGQYRVA